MYFILDLILDLPFLVFRWFHYYPESGYLAGPRATNAARYSVVVVP